ncbi:MAG: class I adenylate-forming enzyme family protein [Sulfuricella sp.]|nr:class I adenylate-forming enzyme family protein [Sulfuricella sp.]
MSLLASLLIRAAARQPDAVALVAAQRTYTYHTLLERIVALTGYLQSREVQPGTVLMLRTGSAETAALSVYTSSWLGCPLFPLNPALSVTRRNALVHLASAREDASALLLDALSDAGESGGSEVEPRGSNGAIELLIATSGTQGEPKAVMLSGANLQAGTLASKRSLPLAAGDAWLACLPFYHIGGMAILYRCAEAGATAVLHDAFEPQRIWLDLEKYHISHISLVPAMLARLLDVSRDSPPPASLKYVLIGGGPLSASLATRARMAGWPLCATYGMSETGSQVATLCELPEDWAPGQVGMPLPGLEVEIIGENGLPASGIGRIRVRGTAVMAGYANPQHQHGLGLNDGWFVSGDLGRLDEQGHLHVLGRHDDMLVSGGVNVHPQMVESALERCSGVAEAALTALADEVWGDLLVAFVVGEAEDEALEQWCRNELPNAMRPRRFVHVKALPRNALSKLDRHALRRLAQGKLA